MVVNRYISRKPERFRVLNENDYFNFGEILGKGRFGLVISGIKKSDQKEYAVKMISKRIKLFLVFELCPKQLARVFRQKEIFQETEARLVLKRLASAVAYLHRQEIVHRDLKLENIMLGINPADPEDELYIKVIDFGLSAIKGASAYDNVLQEFCGTIMYMDSFWAKQISCEAIHLLVRMLNKNPAFRITAQEVQHHPWILQKKINGKQHANIFEMMKEWKNELEADKISWVTLESRKSNECSPDKKFNIDSLSTPEEHKEAVVTPVCRSSFKQEFHKLKMRNKNTPEQAINADTPPANTRIRNADLLAQLRSLSKGTKSNSPSGKNNRKTSTDSESSNNNKQQKKKLISEKLEVEERQETKSASLNTKVFEQPLYVPKEPKEIVPQSTDNSNVRIMETTVIQVKDSGINGLVVTPQLDSNTTAMNEQINDEKSKHGTKKIDKSKSKKEPKEFVRQPSKTKKQSLTTAGETKEKVLEAIKNKIRTNSQ
ncbi:hypothetical protein C0J52_05030 [Blattella germanica]|nr:hypothetical protein C0J52_05030 [Blattella germanica]